MITSTTEEMITSSTEEPCSTADSICSTQAVHNITTDTNKIPEETTDSNITYTPATSTTETTEEITETPTTTFGISIRIKDNPDINSSKKLPQRVIAPQELGGIQLEKATEDNMYLILNKRLLNNFQSSQDENNIIPGRQSNQRNIWPPFFKENFNRSVTGDQSHVTVDDFRNVLTHAMKRNDAQAAVSSRPPQRRTKPKTRLTQKTGRPLESSSLGNILAQFFMQSVGINKTNNSHNNANGIRNGYAQKGERSIFPNFWMQTPTNTKEPSLTLPPYNFSVNRKDKENNLSRMNGLKLEETLNKRIQGE